MFLNDHDNRLHNNYDSSFNAFFCSLSSFVSRLSSWRMPPL
jgi:hypothetical protein